MIPCVRTSVLLATTALLAPRAAAAPSGLALAFESVRSDVCLFEPRVDIGHFDVTIAAGDALEYDVLMPIACAERVGVELVFADGRRSRATAIGASEAWQHVRIPLDAFAGAALAHVELIARGTLSAEIGYRVDDVLVEHANGADATVIFEGSLPGGARIVRDDARNAGAMVVRGRADWEGVRTRLPDAPLEAPLSEQWCTYDLSRLSGALQPDVRGANGPHGSMLAGPCVPMRFTSGETSSFVRATGQRLASEIEGGRYYTVWIAASLDDGPAVTVHAFAYGDMGERRALDFVVPAAGDPGAIDLGGCVLVEVPVASLVPLNGIQLPDEPRLRVHAITFQWRRDGALDSRFRLDWLGHEAQFGSGLEAAQRTSLARYVDDRTVGSIFADAADDENEVERTIFDAAVSGNAKVVDDQVEDRIGKFVAIGAPLKSLRIAFEEGGDDRGALHVPAGGVLSAEELARAVSKFPAGQAVVIDGDPAVLRQAPQLLQSAGVDVALIDSDESLASWNGPDGSSVQLVGVSQSIADAREIAELPWREWIERTSGGKSIPELFVPVGTSETARSDAKSIVALLSRADVAPRVRSATAEEFAAEAVKRLGDADSKMAVPKFTPGDLEPMDDGARDVESIVRRRRTAAAIGELETFGTIAHSDGAPAITARIDAFWNNVSASDTLDSARAMLGDQLGVLAHAATTTGAGTPIVAFNALPWPRTTLVSLAVSDARLLGSDEKELPSQPTADGGVLFAVEVPALGYEVLHGLGTAGTGAAVAIRAPVTVTDWTARNDAIAFTIDPASGALTSLKVLDGDTEMLSAPARLMGDGWTVKSAEFVERGPLRAIARMQLESPTAHATVELVLEARARTVGVRCSLDVVDANAPVAFSIPLKHAAAHALVGVPFGSSSAAARADGSPARHAVLDWIAGTDGTNGTAVLADECAVVRVSTGRLDVEMLAPVASGSARTTTFALVPFADGWKKAGLVQRAQEIALPIELMATDAHAGARDPQHSFVLLSRVDKDGSMAQGADTGLTLSSLQSGADGSWRMRVVETSDRAQDVLIQIDRPVFDAQRVELRDTSIGSLHAERHRALLSIGAMQIANVVVRSSP